MKTLSYLHTEKGLPLTFIVFYCVGLMLFAVPATRELFFLITPYSLVLVSFAVFSHHKKRNVTTLSIFFVIYIVSICIEILGVSKGTVFGTYSYQEGLGIKIGNVPVLIGLNWLLLVYSSHAIVSKLTKKNWKKILYGALMMVLYDLILEIAAPIMRMWEFENTFPPLRNYIMWFLMAACFHALIIGFKIDTENKPARALFVIQASFFICIIIYSSVFIK